MREPPPPPEADKAKDDADFWWGLGLFLIALAIGFATYLITPGCQVSK